MQLIKLKRKLRERHIYQRIHRLYIFIRHELFKPSDFVTLSFTALVVFIPWYFTNDFVWTSIVVFGIYLGLWGFSEFLNDIIQTVTRTTGSDDPFIFSGNYLKKIYNGEPCEITEKVENIDFNRFEFVTEETAHIVSNLNVRAFKMSSWKASFEEKHQRNLSHIKKNCLSMMFVKSLTDENHILGYTHIFPISRGTWEKYIAGGISDNEMDENYIASDQPNQPSYKKPYGLILFSIANVSYDTELQKVKDFRERLGDIYEGAIAYHVNEYMKTQLKDKEVINILFQNMGIKFLLFFRKVVTIGKVLSKDGDRIIIFQLVNRNHKD